MDVQQPDVQNRLNIVLSELDLNATCISAVQHRHLASCDVVLNKDCRVKHLEQLATEIALRMKSKTEPIISPVTEKGVVCLRFAISDSQAILFSSLYNEKETPAGTLPFLLGEGEAGQKIWTDMANNPHMLVAGTTGSGKSVLLHVLIANALKRKDVELMLVDPKFGVEFTKYSNQAEVAIDYNSTIAFLDKLELVMNHRYQRMAKAGTMVPDAFTKKLLIIDEAADLMLQDKKNNNQFENKLCSLAQKSRAAGIYIVLATQRPSVDIITGLIKANFPARVACKVSSSTDSKVVLDRAGAEMLLGRGDAIINNSQYSYTRFQVALAETVAT